ncbi:unnamed protein product [Prorocentrum cordatum]|uniref:Uncharacterized protein n=1 Tax=Prorocentrum cordatum TaxID=2364126 RepID=A0ABN9WJS6_9DINO|nr:unnamed protein product [Polarella glacialis]
MAHRLAERAQSRLCVVPNRRSARAWGVALPPSCPGLEPTRLLPPPPHEMAPRVSAGWRGHVPVHAGRDDRRGGPRCRSAGERFLGNSYCQFSVVRVCGGLLGPRLAGAAAVGGVPVLPCRNLPGELELRAERHLDGHIIGSRICHRRLLLDLAHQGRARLVVASPRRGQAQRPSGILGGEFQIRAGLPLGDPFLERVVQACCMGDDLQDCHQRQGHIWLVFRWMVFSQSRTERTSAMPNAKRPQRTTTSGCSDGVQLDNRLYEPCMVP